MSENITENNQFVEPPEYTYSDIQNLGIKIKSFGLGDKVHMDNNDIQTAWALFSQAKFRGGWTQERKDDFMERVIRVKQRIIDIETEKAKEVLELKPESPDIKD
ncbi:MAG: hypothetical protein WCF92_03490 [bacterium]